jgi:hypothetical protein
LDNNYAFSYVAGNLAITKATLTATADDKTREYGLANPALSVAYSGFRNGDTAAVIDTGATASTAATITDNVGSYAITAAGALDNNYTFAYVNGNLAITKATLTATADDKTREYGLANPALSVAYSGFRNGDTAAVIDTGATASTAATITDNVGNYAITAAGALDNNYTFAYVNGNLAITKATLTATADDKTREYGLANPALSVSYSGFRNGDTAAVIDTGATASTAATITDNVGNYAITAAGALDNNYTFAYVNGNLAITKATVTISAHNKSRLIGAADPTFTYSVSGLRNGDTAAVLGAIGTSTTATALSPAGLYAINLSGGVSANYNSVLNDGVLTVYQSLPIVSSPADNVPSSVQYNQSNQTDRGYNTLYHTNDGYAFLTDKVSNDGHFSSVYVDESGFVKIYFYRNPFEDDEAEPLIIIEPDLYSHSKKQGTAF